MAVDTIADRRRRLGSGRGLKRLSERAHNIRIKSSPAMATKTVPPSLPARSGCFDFSPLVAAVMERLRKCKVRLGQGLLEEEIARIEAWLSFTFPPDLKAILQTAVPMGPGFPDWRAGTANQLRAMAELPLIGISYEVAQGRFWLKQWGSMPPEAEKAVCVAMAALRRAPILVPVFRHCYISASPCLSGNPIFFICHGHVSVCASDLRDFFDNRDFSPESDHASIKSCRRSLSHLDWPANLSSPNHSKHLRLAPSKSEEGDDSSEHELDHDHDLSISSSFDETSFGEYSDESDAASAMVKGISQSQSQSQSQSGPLEKKINGMASCRKIEVWSDLAEKINSNLLMMRIHGEEQQNHVTELKKNERKKSVAIHGSAAAAATPHWLQRYFDDMAALLRKQGWKEQDLADMFLVVSSSSAAHSSCQEDPEPPVSESMSEPPFARTLDLSGWPGHGPGLHDPHPDHPYLDPYPHHPAKTLAMGGLVLYVDLLSDILRSSGWSSADVSEAFDVDMSASLWLSRPRPRPPTAFPSHIAARIADFAAAYL